MRSIFSGKTYSEIITYLFFLSLALVAFFLPLKIRFATLSMASATLFWLLNYKTNKAFFKKDLIAPILIFTSMYWMQVFGLFFTSNLDVGFFQLEKKLPLLAFPILFLASPWQQSWSRWIWVAFFSGVTIAIIICQIDMLVIIEKGGGPYSDFFTDRIFHNSFFTEIIKLHPAYLSFFIILLLARVFTIYKNLTTRQKVFILIWSVYMIFLLLIILMARAGIVAFGVVLFILIVFNAILERKKAVIIPAVITMAVFLLAIQKLPGLKQRVTEPLVGFEQAVKSPDDGNSSYTHIKSWYCAFQSWKQGNMVFGEGTGDEKDVLTECYSENGWMIMTAIRYDSHNEYLSTLVKHGIIGLIMLLTMFLYPLKTIIEKRDMLYLSFLVIMYVACLSESMLRGQNSLVFYAFFNCFLFRNVMEPRNSTLQAKP